MAIDLFDTWQEFRAFALKQRHDQVVITTNVLCHTVKIVQNTGRYIKNVHFSQECYLSPGSEEAKR